MFRLLGLLQCTQSSLNSIQMALMNTQQSYRETGVTYWLLTALIEVQIRIKQKITINAEQEKVKAAADWGDEWCAAVL